MKARLMEVTIRPTRCMVCVDESGVRRRILIAPDGEVESSKGNFVVDAEAAELVLAAFEARGILLVIDYEHQTLGGEFSSPTGKAPAAGWITALTYEPGYGIVADVDWNQEAQEELRKKEYRYVSPVASIRKDDRRMVELHSVGLTNVPAIRRMEAIAAKDQLPAKESETMGSDKESTKKQVNQEAAGEGTADWGIILGLICGNLGITPGESPLDTLKLIEEATKKGGGEEGDSPAEEVAASVRSLLGLPVNANKATVLEAMSARVPASEYSALKAKVGALEQAESVRHADEQVAALIASGKIRPDDRDTLTWARTLAQKNPADLEMAMKHAPDLRPPQGKTTPPAGTTAGATGRAAIIANTAREYDGMDPAYKVMANKAAFVNAELGKAKHQPLTGDEAETLGE